MNYKIVIVDDAPFIREVLNEIATLSGVEVVGEAADGLQAVEMCTLLKPDIVLMDMALPGINGVQATREIIKVLPKTKIIACSTIENEPIVLQAVEAGCCDFIYKPFKVEQLKKVLLATVQQLGEAHG